MSTTYTFYTTGSTPYPENLRARTWCTGKRIDVLWSPVITSGPVFGYTLKRSRRTFALFMDDETEVVYSGTGFSYQDTGLEENTVYYYTLFWSPDGVNWYVSDKTRVAGLSIKDYAAYDGADWLYRRLPQKLQDLDAQPGDDQYTLARYCDVLQCGLALVRGRTEAYSRLANFDAIPGGRIGEPGNQYGILEAVNRQLGFEPQRALGLEVMRRVALGINHVRKRKGTCEGLTEFVKMLTGWDGGCQGATDQCGGGTGLRTWDGVSTYGARVTGTDPAFTPGDVTFDTVTWATLVISFSDELTEHEYARGIFYGAFGERHCILDNTKVGRDTTITFENAPAELAVELLFPVAAVTGLGTDTIVLTDVAYNFPAGKLFQTGQYVGKYVADDSSLVSVQILSSEASSDGSTLTLTLSAATGGAASEIGIACAYDSLASWASRTLSYEYTLGSGDHYHLWDPDIDSRLRGTASDPYDVLWAGNDIFSASPLSPTDTVFSVLAGVAVTIGTVTAVGGSQLTLDVPLTVNEHLGRFVNPNRNQGQLFEILANDGTSLYVDPGTDLSAYAAVGSKFFILSPLDAVRYTTLQSTVRKILPYTTKLYVWFN